MTISNIISVLEKLAPLHLQEDYDNVGLITGDKDVNCSGALLTLDATEAVVQEAIDNNCNLIIAHHPIVFKGMKKINGKTYVERAIILAIKNDIAIYACHTNLDNVINGVNGKIADKLGLINRSVLMPKAQLLQKLTVFIPEEFQEKMEQSLFEAGAGSLGNYSECSFVTEGTGSFKPEANANPFSGKIGVRTVDKEKKIEVIFPVWLQNKVLNAMKMAHPYEEIAFEISSILNEYQYTGSGIIGELKVPMDEMDFMNLLKDSFNVKLVKHTPLLGKMVNKVAFCGGAGSFLTNRAIASGADFFITSDVKYHEFFDADGRLVLADIGHYESEQHTIDLFADVLRQNFPNFALLKTGVNTNPVNYFIS